MTNGKLNMSLSANATKAELTYYTEHTRLITSSTDKHYSLDSKLKMTSPQVVDLETSVTNNNSFQNYPNPNNLTIQITNTLGWVQTIYYDI